MIPPHRQPLPVRTARRRLAVRVFALASAAATTLSLLSCEWVRTPPNVVVVLIDTLRADRLGCYGNERGLTPFLDELATRGVVFSRAYAPSSWTVPSIASIFTSRHATQHHVGTYESKLGESEVTLAEKLAAADYATAGFFANFRLLASLGYAQGFSTWEVVSSLPGQQKGRAATMRQQVQGWLAASRDQRKGRPLLLYLHLMEPHGPYVPPEPFRSRFLAAPADQAAIDNTNDLLIRMNFKSITAAGRALLADLYDGEVASVDFELRSLFAELQKAGILDHAVVAITADHGEEFHEHGRYGHGRALYEESVRVPLILLGPGVEKGRAIAQNVSLLDLAPTLLDLAGLAPEPAFEGRSLVSLAKSAAWWSRSPATDREEQDEAGRDVILELPKTGARWDFRGHESGLVRGSAKLLVEVNSRNMQAFDLASDPLELAPNPPALADVAPTLQAALREKTEALVARAAGAAEKATVDEATKEKLRALGYHP